MDVFGDLEVPASVNVHEPTKRLYKTMRRPVLVSALAVSAAVLGACSNEPAAPNKPVATPSPIGVASPMTSPTVPVAVSPASPMSGSPAKPGASPVVKRDEKVEKLGPPQPAVTPKK